MAEEEKVAAVKARSDADKGDLILEDQIDEDSGLQIVEEFKDR